MPSSASWQDLKVMFSNFFYIKFLRMWMWKTYNQWVYFRITCVRLEMYALQKFIGMVMVWDLIRFSFGIYLGSLTIFMLHLSYLSVSFAFHFIFVGFLHLLSYSSSSCRSNGYCGLHQLWWHEICSKLIGIILLIWFVCGLCFLIILLTLLLISSCTDQETWWFWISKSFCKGLYQSNPFSFFGFGKVMWFMGFLKHFLSMF